MSRPWRILFWLVLVATLAQVGVTTYYFGHEALKAWRTIGKSAVWRGVNFSSSNEFADFIEFLNQSVPKDGMVVLPPVGVGRRSLWHTPYMQFFLMPRQVVNCTSGDLGCPANLAGSQAYLLVVAEDDFPGAAIAADPGRLLMFNQDWGLYLPPGARPGAGSDLPEYDSLVQVLSGLIWPLIWLGLLAVAGTAVVTWLAPVLWLPARIALGYGLGLGVFSLALYLLMLLGARLTPLLALVITAAWCGAGLFAIVSSRRARLPGTPVDRRLFGYLAAAAVLSGLALVVAAGQGYRSSDEIVLWGIKGYAIASQGLSAGVSDFGTRTANYPLNIPLLIAAFKTLFGEALPQSKIVFPLYYLALVTLMLDFLRRRLPLHLAGCLTLAYASAPLVFYHATLAYVNLPLAYYFAGAVILAFLVIEHNSAGSELLSASGSWRVLALSGCFFALAAWNRPEGLIIAGLVWLFLAAALLWGPYRGLPWRQAAQGLAAFGLPLALFGGFWLLSSPGVYQKTGWSQETLRSGVTLALSGSLRLDQAAIVLRSFLTGFLDIRTWGLLGVGLIGLAFISLVAFVLRRRQAGWELVVTALIVTVGVVGMYLVLANDPAHDADWWVNTGLSRMLLPGMTLLWLGLAGLLPAGDMAGEESMNSISQK